LKTGIIIQARKGSTRLPNKMVLPFYNNKGVLELLIEKLIKEFPKKQIILATTTNENDDELVTIAKNIGINIFRGSENNVLKRFIEAAEKFQFKNMIRICADNPFLDIPHIHILIKEIEKNRFDYLSYKTENGLPTIKSHLGLFAEGVTLDALQKVNDVTGKALYQEHVTNYIYEHKNQFKILLMDLPCFMNETESFRLTLDTKEDFQFEQELYLQYANLSTVELINCLNQDKSLLFKMKNEIKKHIK
jgi:spore coat polysaccharide biosynthesis protein SpsF